MPLPPEVRGVEVHADLVAAALRSRSSVSGCTPEAGMRFDGEHGPVLLEKTVLSAPVLAATFHW
jgi:hypothetical protein